MSSKFTASLCLQLSFLLLLQTVFSAQLLPPGAFCSQLSLNFTADHDPYATSLNELMQYLSYHSASTGFSLGSKGANQYKTYGLALCYSYVSPTDCLNCVVEASKKIRRQCPYRKGANIWYDDCFLKYMNLDFFGLIDFSALVMCNPGNATDPISFNQHKTELLSQLANNVSTSLKMYRTGELELAGSAGKLYAEAQCTRDLFSVDCKQCLDHFIAKYACNGRPGGRIYGGSCYLRFETYDFFSASKLSQNLGV
ncbi:Cysteine-rich repeat secretory protein 38 [Morella rubra]|uniref:Cysteine-rich repeat secretory protein 38 n=1 Tax=Morella rubra TaxID=262757 RepID=A0A6A1VCI9_9ROSI|nr:Cysteine-rich repeat secretory protein 38 [Morella rubra]